MIKLLKFIVGLATILIVVVVCLVLFWLGPAVKKTVETVGPKAIGAPLTIEKLTINPLGGIVVLEGLFVGNPEGFTAKSAVELKKFKVAVSLLSLRTDTIVIKEIVIDGPEFTYERKKKTDNISAIQKNIEAFAGKEGSGGGEKPSSEKKPTEKKPAKKVVIEKLVLRNGIVKAKIAGIPTPPLALPDIEKTDIGKDSGTTWTGVAAEVSATIYEAITSAVANIGVDGGAVSETINTIKGIFK
ncbi:DUF748 domain-containing protein [Pontiella sulfatireligans]|uniref:Uncharacterized protein n=1 Tax=Pontiella sulfatireligans TaxID=2750658 RepID=A0A6C2UPX3_9BACT|nr:AsmA family protein [Pontiella sulfatireligans]VGO21056.1 hypothetical protein SCARR_03125 [Pontiella sulfatireligans]